MIIAFSALFMASAPPYLYQKTINSCQNPPPEYRDIKEHGVCIKYGEYADIIFTCILRGYDILYIEHYRSPGTKSYKH